METDAPSPSSGVKSSGVGVGVSIDELVKAVQYGDYMLVETAIEEYQYSANTIDTNGCSLLHWAAINNRVDIAKFLINKKASINLAGGTIKHVL